MRSTFPMFMRAGAVWLLILVLAFVNGAARELFLIPRLGRAPGLFLSGILLSTVILVLAFASVQWIRPRSPADAWRIGGFWLAATLVFEFGLGWAQQKSLVEMLAAYSFRGGNTWLLVVFATLLAPRIAYGWRYATTAQLPRRSKARADAGPVVRKARVDPDQGNPGNRD